MLHENHEPETKGFNKARDFQDAIIRARKAGCTDPLQVADAIFDWFMDASRTVQVATLQYAIGRIWSTTESKITDVIEMESAALERDIDLDGNDEAEYTPLERPSAWTPPARSAQTRTPPEVKEAIKAKVRAAEREKWLDILIPMTGAQVRYARMLPDEMANQIGDDQRVGDVFSVDELRALKP